MGGKNDRNEKMDKVIELATDARRKIHGPTKLPDGTVKHKVVMEIVDVLSDSIVELALAMKEEEDG